MLLPTDVPHPLVARERELRRQIDRSISRALIDGAYARLLLEDPTLVLGEYGCSPQDYLKLRGIRARDLGDFAVQAEALFWPTIDTTTTVTSNEPGTQEAVQLAAAAR